MEIQKLTLLQKKLRRKILEIVYKANTSHLGSCFSAIDAIEAIYSVKKKNERFVLSNGHAGVALYAVLEQHGLFKNPKIEKTTNIHPDRNLKKGIFVSTGSLGQGLPIAVGIALSDRKKNVYCMISDGETTEGSIWESLRIAIEQKIENLKIILIANGWGAYGAIDLSRLYKRITAFGYNPLLVNGHTIEEIERALRKISHKKPLFIFAKTTVEQLPFLEGQAAHYHVMSKEEFRGGMEILQK